LRLRVFLFFRFQGPVRRIIKKKKRKNAPRRTWFAVLSEWVSPKTSRVRRKATARILIDCNFFPILLYGLFPEKLLIAFYYFPPRPEPCVANHFLRRRDFISESHTITGYEKIPPRPSDPRQAPDSCVNQHFPSRLVCAENRGKLVYSLTAALAHYAFLKRPPKQSPLWGHGIRPFMNFRRFSPFPDTHAHACDASAKAP